MGTRLLVLSSASSLRFFSPNSNSRPKTLTGAGAGAGAGAGTGTVIGAGSRAPPPPPLRVGERGAVVFANRGRGRGSNDDASDDGYKAATQAQAQAQVVLWTMEAVYILWLFLLPYAPGDPVWAISQATITDLVALSLNFFFLLPLLNYVGIHFIQAPLLHPMAEGLFNFVIAWTLMFAPLLFTDCKRDRYNGSLDLLWGFQMFLTNTFLIPYMAIRLNEKDPNQSPPKLSKLGSVMVQGAPLVGLIGGFVCFLSLIWAAFGCGEEQFGGIIERTQYLVSYLGSERLAYAFIWDIVLYCIFQPWLIGENIENVKRDYVGIVSWLKFVPVMGLVSYLLSLDIDENSS